MMAFNTFGANRIGWLFCPGDVFLYINGKPYVTIWMENSTSVKVIDQRYLPHKLVVEELKYSAEAARAIKEMHVRGAPLIGATAAYGMYLSALNAPRGSNEEFITSVERDAAELLASRPTAVNLSWAVERSLKIIHNDDVIDAKVSGVLECAEAVVREEREACKQIGLYGVTLIENIFEKKGSVVNILTHCNAGSLACIDYGTATAPIYEAVSRGIPVHVYVDETRPRNQGGQLTAFELGQNGVPYTIITDNAGGHLMQHGMVDIVIVGSDRTTRTGDVANKIGTYLKALAAKANGIPFYVALTSSAIDWNIRDGINEIKIEERDPAEIKYITGMTDSGNMETVLITPQDSPALNIGFDVTPREYVTGLITERGICSADETGIMQLFPRNGK